MTDLDAMKKRAEEAKARIAETASNPWDQAIRRIFDDDVVPALADDVLALVELVRELEGKLEREMAQTARAWRAFDARINVDAGLIEENE
jgi:hypothetical protein